jgi:hypothetical protein
MASMSPASALSMWTQGGVARRCNSGVAGEIFGTPPAAKGRPDYLPAPSSAPHHTRCRRPSRPRSVQKTIRVLYAWSGNIIGRIGPRHMKKFMLALALLLLATATAIAGQGDFECPGNVLVEVRQRTDLVESVARTGEHYVLTVPPMYPLNRRYLEIPAIRFDPKTREMTLGGKRCSEGD